MSQEDKEPQGGRNQVDLMEEEPQQISSQFGNIPINGYTQAALDELWDTLANVSATRIVEEDVLNVMTITTKATKFSVSRIPGYYWIKF